MNNVVEDMLGKKFNVEQDKRGNEIWRSQEYPEFSFLQITEKFKNEDGRVILWADYFGYNHATHLSDVEREMSVFNKDKKEILDIMPITDKMFCAIVNDRMIMSKQGTCIVCNAASNYDGFDSSQSIYVGVYNVGRGALTKYWGENKYGVMPGSHTYGDYKDRSIYGEYGGFFGSYKTKSEKIEYIRKSYEKYKLSMAIERVRNNIDNNKKITDDIKSGIAKTKESGYKHISRTPKDGVKTPAWMRKLNRDRTGE